MNMEVLLIVLAILALCFAGWAIKITFLQALDLLDKAGALIVIG